MKIFSGTANRSLAEKIASNLGFELGDARVVRFEDGEVFVKIDETVRGEDCYVIQSTSQPVNENIMELLIFIDALRRASARQIVAVLPYYGYARQDRKASPREPITAKLVANILTSAGANRVMFMDLHAKQIQGFFDIPADHMEALPLLAKYFINKGLTGEKVVVVSPDVGGVKRARALAEWLETSIAIVDKRRPRPNVAEVMNVIGDINGKTAIFIDDLIDTGGTITQGAEAIMAKGATDVYACCTHAVFSGPAIKRLEASCIKEVIITDTIELPEIKKLDKITILSVDKLLTEAIKRVQSNQSLSQLFERK